MVWRDGGRGRLSVTRGCEAPWVVEERQDPLAQLGIWKATKVVGEMPLGLLGLKQQYF